MLYYLCEKADLIRNSFCTLGVVMLFVLPYFTDRQFTKVSKKALTVAWIVAILCLALFVLLPDSDLAFELCRRAGITF